jgi:hypothetical protein
MPKKTPKRQKRQKGKQKQYITSNEEPATTYKWFDKKQAETKIMKTRNMQMFIAEYQNRDKQTKITYIVNNIINGITSGTYKIFETIFEYDVNNIHTKRCCFTLSEIHDMVKAYLSAKNDLLPRTDIGNVDLAQKITFKHIYLVAISSLSGEQEFNRMKDTPTTVSIDIGSLNSATIDDKLAEINGLAAMFVNELQNEQNNEIVMRIYEEMVYRELTLLTVSNEETRTTRFEPENAANTKAAVVVGDFITTIEKAFPNKSSHEDYLDLNSRVSEDIELSTSNIDLYLASTLGIMEGAVCSDFFVSLYTEYENRTRSIPSPIHRYPDVFDNIPFSKSFKNILTLISDHPDSLNLSMLNRIYRLTKTANYMIHDKPDDAIVDIILRYLINPSVEYYTSRIAKAEINTCIRAIADAWVGSFKKHGGPVVSQSRCHSSSQNQDDIFIPFMASIGIDVPRVNILYNKPIALVKSNAAELERICDILGPCTHSYTDAVGTKWPNTCSQIIRKKSNQISLVNTISSSITSVDAACESKQNPSYFVIDNIELTAIPYSQIPRITRKIRISKTPHDVEDKSFHPEGISEFVDIPDADPVIFGGIEVFSLQNGKDAPFIMYYVNKEMYFPTETYPDEVMDAQIILLIKKLYAHFKIDFTQYCKVFNKFDELLILIAVSYSRLSQNASLAFLEGSGIDLSSTIRNNVHIDLRDLPVIWLAQDFLETDSIPNNIRQKVQILLALISKETGDQSKISLTDEISKVSNVALWTVDSFLSDGKKSGINVFKSSATLEISKVNDDPVDSEELTRVLDILLRFDQYAVLSEISTTIRTSLYDIINNIIGVLTNYFENDQTNPKVLMHILIYSSMLFRLQTPLLIDEASFNQKIIDYTTTWQSGGVFDDISLLENRHAGIKDLKTLFEIIDTFENEDYKVHISTKTTNNSSVAHSDITPIVIGLVKDADFYSRFDAVCKNAPLFWLIREYHKLVNLSLSRSIRTINQTFGIDVADIENQIKNKYVFHLFIKLSAFIKKHMNNREFVIEMVFPYLQKFGIDISIFVSVLNTEKEDPVDQAISAIENAIDVSTNDEETEQIIASQDEESDPTSQRNGLEYQSPTLDIYSNKKNNAEQVKSDDHKTDEELLQDKIFHSLFYENKYSASSRRSPASSRRSPASSRGSPASSRGSPASSRGSPASSRRSQTFDDAAKEYKYDNVLYNVPPPTEVAVNRQRRERYENNNERPSFNKFYKKNKNPNILSAKDNNTVKKPKGGGKNHNNCYTKKLYRVRKTRKNTKRPKYIKKNATRRRR